MLSLITVFNRPDPFRFLPSSTRFPTGWRYPFKDPDLCSGEGPVEVLGTVPYLSFPPPVHLFSGTSMSELYEPGPTSQHDPVLVRQPLLPRVLLVQLLARTPVPFDSSYPAGAVVATPPGRGPPVVTVRSRWSVICPRGSSV